MASSRAWSRQQLALWAVAVAAVLLPLPASAQDTLLPAGNLQVPKVALLFLTRGAMPHEAAWAAWLAAAKRLVPRQKTKATGCSPSRPAAEETRDWTMVFRRDLTHHYTDQLLFSAYVHPAPNATAFPPGSLFWRRELDSRTQVAWGDHSMVVAMRLLLRAALADPLNQRFVYLCELSIPLYHPTVVWQQLMAEDKSRVNACSLQDDSQQDALNGLKRWTPAMLPLIPRELWLKSSQWAGLTRRHAELIDKDQEILDLFSKECRFPHCVGDEHYMPTLLAYHGVGNETTCIGNAVSSTWTDNWDARIAAMDEGHHPLMFPGSVINADLLLALRQNTDKWRSVPPCRDAAAIRHAAGQFIETDAHWRADCFGTQPQAYNATLLAGRTCTLFARKFDPKGAEQVVAAITSCDQRLAIAPNAKCKAPHNTRSVRLYVRHDEAP